MHIISRFKTLRRLLLPKCPYHNGFSFRCMHSDSYEWLNSEFCDHLETLRRKWLNASCPVTLDHPIDQWISQTRRKCLVGEIRNDELDSLSKKLNEMDVSPEQLIEALELLSLWPNVIGTFPFVPNFEEYLIIKLRNILHKISLELCFLNKTNKQFQTDPPLANKLQMLSIGNLWSFIDKPGKWDSVHYQIALKLCHKDGGRIIRAFRNVSVHNYLKLLGLLSRIRTLSDRDGEFESLKFMKCRDNFINIKNFVLEKLGDENLLRECKVLPHHEYTQIIWVTDKQTGRISKFPSGFDDYSNGDIKKPYSNELNWYALSFSLVNTLQPITVEIHGEKISPYVTCIKRLGYKVYFITLSENDDSVDPALSYVSALMKSFDG
ncbi:unnamed protein product [Lepeophtheirus salmonis]|uniref:(salmon louse) hypothetical protein n=2 Tax=Lepeophtheirus salmonis TaxID=72036 RepID=A0A7R8CQ97_LEPSM|nr:unnamed protein product [Lepeophtheirus salmonis]CAF2891089.1 unnamed protein product [Lepeophtheirus salmonis]